MKIPKDIFLHCRFGLEREALRIGKSGKISRLRHPCQLGSPLTHSYITTDYAESQLEWNTPPSHSIHSSLQFLEELMAYTTQAAPDLFYWPYSMPPELPENIAVAEFGESTEGRKKHLYRQGLMHRYGQNLQMISGTHFNFSFSEPLLKSLYSSHNGEQSFKEFRDALYLKMIRNYLREGWLITYLFGMTPAMDSSYIKGVPKEMKKYLKHTLYGEYATSIRMSSLGYYSRIQSQLSISFNSLDEYLRDMKSALSTPKKAYKNIPKQLNDSILQIPNEHYARIRPKASVKLNQSPLKAIEERGIEYLELRGLDITPYTPSGIDQEALHFLSLFLFYSAEKESSPLEKECQHCLVFNQNQVALKGRRPNLELKDGDAKKRLGSWGREILLEMKKLARRIEFPHLNILEDQIKKLDDPSSTPSAQMIEDLIKNKQELRSLGLARAKEYQATFKQRRLSQQVIDKLSQATQESIREKEALETKSRVLLEGYEHLELSTQVLIREALKQNIQVEVLDPQDNILRLSKGSVSEYVKQATKTSKDSYVTQQLMENKQITKKLLREKGFVVPYGQCYSSLEEADYSKFSKKQVVVKGKSTNSGEGIFFVSPNDSKGFREAIVSALKLNSSVIVEEFIPWKEYRLLVIGGKTVGVICREGAHVIGDGAHTIHELVQIKNEGRHPTTRLSLGSEEKKHLATQSLTPSSIPKKGKKIPLRQNSNLSTGGDAVDFTDTIHSEYKKIAEGAANAIEAKVSGVDMLIKSPRQKPSPKNQVILELNHNPILYGHAFPNKGKPRNVAKPLLKLLNLI